MPTDTARTQVKANRELAKAAATEAIGSQTYDSGWSGRQELESMWLKGRANGAAAQHTADIELVKDMRDDAIDRRLNRHVYQTFKAVLVALRAQ